VADITEVIEGPVESFFGLELPKGDPAGCYAAALRLRQLAQTDLEDYAALCADAEVMRELRSVLAILGVETEEDHVVGGGLEGQRRDHFLFETVAPAAPVGVHVNEYSTFFRFVFFYGLLKRIPFYELNLIRAGIL